MGLLDGAIESAAEHAITAVSPPAGALIHFGLWLRKHWQTIVVVVAIGAIAALIWRAPWAESRGFHSRDVEVAALKKQYDDLVVADAKAQAEAEAKAKGINQAQLQAKEATNNVLQDELARARADAARYAAAYAQRLRAPAAGAATGDGAQPADAGAGGSAGAAAGGGEVPLLDDGDLQICTENTVKARAWLGWWKRLKAIPR